MRLYWDTNVFVRLVESADAVSDTLTKFVDTRFGEGYIITSELTLAELLVGPFRTRDASKVETYDALLDHHGAISLKPVGKQLLIAAARIRAEHPPLKLPDAIHIATAEAHDCDVLVSADRRLPDRPGMRVVPLQTNSLDALFNEIP